jgi:ankyrin repeat protein
MRPLAPAGSTSSVAGAAFDRLTWRSMRVLPAGDPTAEAIVRAIRSGDVSGLEALLVAHPDLVQVQLRAPNCDDTRSLLHIVADWPGHLPNAAAMVKLLATAGADVDARGQGRVSETPLQWAASCDDIAVLDALLDAGADLEADGAVIGGGTALDDAVAFGQWNAARRLVERGATVSLRDAAALGLVERMAELVVGADEEKLAGAMWYACHGGQRETAEQLLALGANPNWVAPWDETTPLDAAARSGADALVAWLRCQGAHARAELR